MTYPHTPARRRCVSVTPTDRTLQALARWVEKEQGRAIICLDGKKAAVMLTYTEYEQILKQRTEQMKGELLQKLEAITKRPRPSAG
jgi:hypothetical protein